jgi:hypothetical protein
MILVAGQLECGGSIVVIGFFVRIIVTERRVRPLQEESS